MGERIDELEKRYAVPDGNIYHSSVNEMLMDDSSRVGDSLSKA